MAGPSGQHRRPPPANHCFTNSSLSRPHLYRPPSFLFRSSTQPSGHWGPLVNARKFRLCRDLAFQSFSSSNFALMSLPFSPRRLLRLGSTLLHMTPLLPLLAHPSATGPTFVDTASLVSTLPKAYHDKPASADIDYYHQDTLHHDLDEQRPERPGLPCR